MSEVVWNNDCRYPGPKVHHLPGYVTGTPTDAELDAQPRLFTWGELKEIIQTGELQYLSRNKEMQARYEEWIGMQKETWGSSESYLINARLPWGNVGRDKPLEPTYDQRTAMDHPEIDLTPATNPDSKRHKANNSGEFRSGSAAVAAKALSLNTHTPGTGTPGQASHLATAATTPGGSGASTPASVAYVSLESVLPRVNKALARASNKSKRTSQVVVDGDDSIDSASSTNAAEADDDDDDPAYDVFLRWDPKGLDPEKFAVLPNDWPYCVPYGVKHYCVWSRVPIAHPVLVNYDSQAWARIEEEGLGGFTGVVPVLPDSLEEAEVDATSSLPTPPSSGATTGAFPPANVGKAKEAGAMAAGAGRAGPSKAGRGGWYAVDVQYGGHELRRWAGVEYEAKGGVEVGRMVRGLWDERGWETVWFVNPPRLQSVPGFSHFHVFARRKTPPEIDVSEQVFADSVHSPSGASPTLAQA